jgi:hypothetical protein
MATTPKTLTYEDWLKLPEVEGVEEVVYGVIVKLSLNVPRINSPNVIGIMEFDSDRWFHYYPNKKRRVR